MSGKNELCKCSDKQVCNSSHHVQPIYDVEECEKAALSLEAQFKDSRYRDRYPKGCYYLPYNYRVYFNTHSVGRKTTSADRMSAEQVCKFEQIKGKLIHICLKSNKSSL